VEPAIALDLGLELPRAPAGIAQRHQCAARAASAGNGPEHVESGGQPDLLVDRQG
jgi:hypothetical protein